MSDAKSSPSSPRLAALDGLRGFAALIVVFWHCTLTVGMLGSHFPLQVGEDAQPGQLAEVGSLPWWLFETPLRLLTMGSNAVSIFFVLSGFVLVLPLLRGRQLDLWAYYPRRIARLWLPSAASVVLAVTIIMLTDQRPDAAETLWGKAFSFEEVDASTAVQSLFLITGTNTYNNPLWSLKWEMLYSLMLPLVFVAVLRIRRDMLWWAAAGCAILVSAGGALGVSALSYGPLFVAGAVAARLFFERRREASSLRSWSLVVLGFLGIAVPDMCRTLWGWDIRVDYGAATQGFVAVGATCVVLGLTSPSGVTRLFSSHPFRWLGRISFSLYLVHAPIIIAGVHVFPDWPAAAALLVTVPAALLLAWAFTRGVEEPAARLARRVGDLASSRISVISTSTSRPT